MKSVVTSLLLVLSVTSIAQAQPADLSARERAYVDGLAATLGSVTRAERVGFFWTPTDAPGIADHVETLEGQAQSGSRLRVTGLRIEAASVVVRRVKLKDMDAARLFAARSELGAEGPLVGEVRGDQVVFVHGEPVRDATFARRALDAAWRGLPVSAPSAEATFANLRDADLVLATTTHQGPIAESVLNAFAKAREVAGRQQPGCKAFMHGPEDVSVQLEQGLTARAHADDAGRAWVWSTGAHDRAAAMARYFEVLTGSSSDRAPTTQRDGLEDVLTRTHASMTSSGSIMENDGSVPPAPFPMGDEALKQAHAAIDAAIRRELEGFAREAAKEVEAVRAGKPAPATGEWSEWSEWSSEFDGARAEKRVIVDRPLGE